MRRLMVRMTGRSVHIILLTVLIAIGSFATTLGSTSQDQTSSPVEYIKVGNCWEYAYEYDRYSDTIHYVGNITMRVAGEEQRVVSGEIANVFLVDLFGTGSISGDWFGNPVTGTLNLKGEDMRLHSNFSIVSEHMFWKEYMDYTTGTSNVTSNADITYEPALDDVIADTELAIGANFTSRSQMTIEQWMNDSTTNETQNAQNETSLTFTLVSQNLPVVTPAGSFLCDKYLVSFHTKENELNAMWYYSEKVGNYVKSEGAFSWIFSLVPIADLELRSYSYSTDNVPPKANAGEDQTVKMGDTVTLNGSASSDNVGIVTYNWTFADTNIVNLSGEVAHQVFASEGIYVINLTVSDGAGNSDWDTVNVTVEKKISSILGANAILIGGIVAVIVVAVAAVLFLRKRKGEKTPDTYESFVFTVPPK